MRQHSNQEVVVDTLWPEQLDVHVHEEALYRQQASSRQNERQVDTLGYVLLHGHQRTAYGIGPEISIAEAK